MEVKEFDMILTQILDNIKEDYGEDYLDMSDESQGMVFNDFMTSHPEFMENLMSYFLS